MDRERLLLVVVDIQEKLLPVIYNREEVVSSSQKLMRIADICGIPVVLTEQYPKGLGKTVPEIKEVFDALGTEKHLVEKITFSCVGEPKFTDILSLKRKQGRSCVVVCGIEAHICVYQTVRDPFRLRL